MESPTEPVEVMVEPSRVDGGISRVVGVGNDAFSETWDGTRWVRGNVFISSIIGDGSPIPEAELKRLGITS